MDDQERQLRAMFGRALARFGEEEYEQPSLVSYVLEQVYDARQAGEHDGWQKGIRDARAACARNGIDENEFDRWLGVARTSTVVATIVGTDTCA